MKLIEEQTFTAADFKSTTFEIAHYELCVFNSIDFTKFTFSEAKFVDCEFVDCDLSMVSLTGSMLQNITFTRCKMLGLFFETVKPFLFEVRFQDCNLESSSFENVRMENTVFQSCKLAGVDFTNSNLKGVQFEACDLLNATFYNSKLEKADFTTARNFSINPQHNQTKGSIVSSANLEGFLQNAGLDFRS